MGRILGGDSYENGNEPSGSEKYGEIFANLNYC
jgi:hypothetical protein